MRRGLLLLLLVGACDGWGEDPPPLAPLPPPPGSVARGTAARQAALAAPGPDATPALIAQGAARYAIFCTPCHGRDGMGGGVVVARGMPRPAPIAGLPAARSMAALAENRAGSHPVEDRIQPAERWAIARFVESLPGGRAP